MRLFVYGSLKQNGSARNLMQAAKFIQSIRTTKDYQLRSISWFPGMFKESSNQGVYGELYDLPDEDKKSLDDLNRYECVSSGLFKLQEVELEDGSKAFSYFYNHSAVNCPIILDGIWNNGST